MHSGANFSYTPAGSRSVTNDFFFVTHLFSLESLLSGGNPALLLAFIFGISGTLLSVLIRIEIYSSGNRIISPENPELL